MQIYRGKNEKLLKLLPKNLHICNFFCNFVADLVRTHKKRWCGHLGFIGINAPK